MTPTASPNLRTQLCVVALLAALAAPAAADWPRFRGDGAHGLAAGTLPITWNAAEGDRVRWRTPIPGLSHSSPIVAGGRVYAVTAVGPGEPGLVLGDEGGIDLAEDAGEHSWRIYALDRDSGEVVWEREAYRGEPRAGRHVKSSLANATPATDGRIVVAIFGSQGMVAYDLDGEELWRRDLGILDPGLFGDTGSHWGHASSPVVWRDRVFVQVDRHADSYLAAFALDSGEEIWRVDRDEKPVWATPVVHGEVDEARLLVVGGDFDRAYDPESGRELWRFPRDYQVKTPSPFVADGRLILAGGYRGKPVFALDPATGEKLWESEPGGPYTSTPVAYDGLLYFVRDTGVVNALDLATGERAFRERLGDGATFSASAVAGDGKIYLTSEQGRVFVLEAGRELAVLTSNDMGEPCMATPAIDGGVIFFRCRSHLYAVGSPASADEPEA